MSPPGDGHERASASHEAASEADAALWVSLVSQIEKGDRGAEAEFARLFYVRVRPMASVYLRWADAAKDIAQETILAALEALRAGKVREPEKLPAFVLGIARNLINNHKRKESRALDVSEDPPDPPADTDPALARLDEQQRSLLRRSLKRLNRTDRRILLLTLIDDLTPREVAPIVGLTPEVVRTRKSRAVKAIADEIEGMTRMPCPDHILKRDETR